MDSTRRELRRLDSRLNCEVQNRRNLDKSLEKDKRGEQVLTRQSESTLRYKRKLQIAKIRLEAAERAKARQAQQMANQQRQLKEHAALCLLRFGQPLQAIAQAAGLTEAEITELTSKD